MLITPSKQRTIACVTSKGGAGKSTIADALASVLVEVFDVPTTLFDMDPQGTASTSLGATRNPGGSAKVICSSLGEAHTQIVLANKLKIYSGNDDLDNPKIDRVPQGNLKSFIEKEKIMASVIDTSNKDWNLTNIALSAATHAVVIFEPDRAGYQEGTVMLEQIAQFPHVTPVIVFNQFQENRELSTMVLEDIQANFPMVPLVKVHHSEEFKKARMAQVPIVSWKKKGRHVDQITELLEIIYK